MKNEKEKLEKRIAENNKIRQELLNLRSETTKKLRKVDKILKELNDEYKLITE